MLYDKIFVIHLERDEYRKKSIETQFVKEGITNYEWIHAIDGQNEDLNKYDFKVIPDWVDPYSSKIMTKGEIGCALSHYLIWKRMVEEKYDNVLILEDDIILCDDFSQQVNQIGDNISEVDYDFLYLGRKPLNQNTEEKVNDYVTKAKYSYGMHAYILTLLGANKLLKCDYLHNLLPTDEFLPILYDPEYPYTKYISYFTDKPRINAYAVSPSLINVLSGELYNSNTYCTDPFVSTQETNNYMILSIGSSSDSFMRFTYSCELYGHPYKILMRDSSGITNDNKTRNILKSELLSWKKEELDSKIILVIPDGETAIINANKDELLQKYRIISQTPNMVLFSGKKDHWPVQRTLLQNNPPSPTEYKYLNSGVFIGKACNILSLLMIEDYEYVKDAIYYTDKYLNQTVHGIHIYLDFGCEIFQPIIHNSIENEIDIQFQKSRIRNKSTGSFPCVLHACGHLSLLTRIHFNSICNYLGNGWNNTYKYCNTNETEYPKVYIHNNGIQSIENALDYPSKKCIIRRNILPRYMINDFLNTDAEYFFYIDKYYDIRNKNVLRELIQYKKKVICPMFKKEDNEYWSNFWGELDDNNYYKRSFDYIDIINYRRKSLWNVPYITGIYLIHRTVLEQNPLIYIENERMDIDMRICHNLRNAKVFMYVTNINKYGIILEKPEKSVNIKQETISKMTTGIRTEYKNTIFDMDDLNWESKYIHPNYLQDICEEPCTDVFIFPLFTSLFCSEMIKYCNKLNKWSDGNTDEIDFRIGTYENVPTRDIHLKQIGFESQWEKIVFKYIAPMASKMYNNYKTKNINISFVVKYSMDGQRELTPHHDASTYTVNICLNADFEGGGCRFLRQNYNMNNNKIGYVSMHPGKITHYHEGLPITNGIRYILVSFIN